MRTYWPVSVDPICNSLRYIWEKEVGVGFIRELSGDVEAFGGVVDSLHGEDEVTGSTLADDGFEGVGVGGGEGCAES